MSMNERKTWKVADQQSIKKHHLSLIFRLINRLEPVSRIRLSKETQLSPTTVSTLVDELLRCGLIKEVGMDTKKTSGRKPILLTVNKEFGFIVSIEVKKDLLVGGLFDMTAQLLRIEEMAYPNVERLGEHINLVIESLIKSSSYNFERLMGIAVGVPGIIDFQRDRVVSSTVIESLDQTHDFLRPIKMRFAGRTVVLENESCLSAYAEIKRYQKPQGKHMILVDINRGVGCGLIIDQTIYKGPYQIAGEFGHMVIDRHGERCVCGNVGCLETLVSIPAIVKKASPGFFTNGHNDPSDASIMRAYDNLLTDWRQSKEYAYTLMYDVADCLAIGLNNVIHLLDIRDIVISGQIARAGPAFLQRVKDRIQSMGFSLYKDKMNIRYSDLGEHPSVLGGADYMLEYMFKPERIKTRTLFTQGPI